MNPEGNQEPALVLIVDDQPMNCQLLQKLVEQAGYRTVTALDGATALELVVAHRPEVVLLDVWMPQMDGFAVLRAIRSNAQLSYTPVIMITAVEDAQARQQAYMDGADDFLLKPVDGTILLARLRTALYLKNTLSQVEQDRERFVFVAKISRDLNKLHSLDEMLAYMVDVCATALNADNANMLLVSQDQDTINVLVSSRATNLEPQDVRLVLQKGAAGHVVRTGVSLLIHDVSNDEHWLPLPGSVVQTGSGLLVPIRDQEELLGVVSVYHGRTHYFNLEDQTLLELVASQIAGVIQQARLREDQELLTSRLTTQTRQLELINALAQALAANQDFENLYDVIDEQMRLLMGNIAIALFSLEDISARLIYVSRQVGIDWEDYPELFVNQATSKGLHIIISLDRVARYSLSDVSEVPLIKTLRSRGYLGGMGVPLHHQGRVMGILVLAAFDRSFTAEEESLLEMARPHLAVALANAQSLVDRAARQAEQAELVHLRNMAELSGQMAHHFNNLFAAILGNTQLAELEATSPDQQILLATVVDQVRDGAAMISRLRLLRGGDRVPPPFPLDISEALPTLLDHISARWPESDQLQLEIEPGLFVLVHERELQTLCTELINNAFESGSPADQIKVSLVAVGKDVFMHVRDQGRGIRDEHMQLIWRPFWTTQGPQRLGLGLPICASLMWRMGGQVSLTPNAPDAGVTATVRLPRIS